MKKRIKKILVNKR